MPYRVGNGSARIGLLALVSLLLGMMLPLSFSIAAPLSAAIQEPNNPPAADANQPEQPPAPAAAPVETDKSKKDQSMLVWLVGALGWEYTIAFLFISFVFVALVIMNLLSARRDQICPQSLIDGFESLLDGKRYQEAYELAKTDESFLGNVLSSGLARLSNGYDHAIASMQEVGADESMKLQHRLSYIALIGTVSPMVGLLGTVDGMIRAFFVIAGSGGTPDTDKLADGIAKALLTTLVGLLIAIPAMTAYNILRNRFERLELEVGIASSNLMGRFEKVGQKKE